MIIKKNTPTFILQFHVWYANLAIDHKWQISDSLLIKFFWIYSCIYTVLYVLCKCGSNLPKLTPKNKFQCNFNETRWQTLDCCGKENKSHEKCLSDIFCVKFLKSNNFLTITTNDASYLSTFLVIFLPLIPEISTVFCFSIVFQNTIDQRQNIHKLISKMWKKTYM